MKKELLFSVTKKDFTIQAFCAGGKGGQHQNKTSSGIRIIHLESGARGESRSERSQNHNKKLAFERLIKTKEFQLWHKRKAAMAIKGLSDLDKEINNMMKEDNLKIEIRENNKWKKVVNE